MLPSAVSLCTNSFLMACAAFPPFIDGGGPISAMIVAKLLLGLGEPLAGRLMLYDALGAEFRTIRIRRDAGCALCGDSPTLTDLSQHLHVAPETA